MYYVYIYMLLCICIYIEIIINVCVLYIEKGISNIEYSIMWFITRENEILYIFVC